MPQVPFEYLFSKKTRRIWPPVILIIGVSVALFNIYFPIEAKSKLAIHYGWIFPRIIRDYDFLIQYDAGFAVKYLNFSFQLMSVTIFVTLVFTAWHLIYLVRHGARYPADDGDNDGGVKVHLGYALLVYFIYYFSTAQISFALPGESAIFKIPMSAMGKIKSAILYSGLIGMFVPLIVVDYFNRGLRLLTKSKDK